MQEFSMLGGKVRGKQDHLDTNKDLKLLKFAAIYGANASGKSNLVSAMDFAQTTILRGIPKRCAGAFYRNIPENQQKGSYFEFEFKIKDQYFAYGFEIILSDCSLISEWLIEIFPSGENKTIFARDIKAGTYDLGNYFKNKDHVNTLRIYAEGVKSDDQILFLNEMNRSKRSLYKEANELKVFRDVFGWFRYNLDINYPDAPISKYSYFLSDKSIDEISEIIQGFGLGISRFGMVATSIDSLKQDVPKDLLDQIMDDLEEGKKIQRESNEKKNTSLLLRGDREFCEIYLDDENNIKVKTLELEHKNSIAKFHLSDESDGTIRLLDLIEILLSENSEKVYVIDEIDRCLHPQLVYKLVQSYLEVCKTSKRQLIITTHEAYLMDHDLLRRDEIWFADKNETGETSLYSLEDYNVRFDQKIDKAYLEGRYGGVPIFSSIFPTKEK